MSINKNKVYVNFRVTFSDEEINQNNEIKSVAEDFASRNATNSGLYIKAYVDLYEKHLKVRIDCFINSLLELFQEDYFIPEQTKNEWVQEIYDHIDSQYDFKSNSLKSIMASVGQNNLGITSVQLSTLRSHFNEIKNIKGAYLTQLIEKHNNKALQIKKNNSFWNTKNGIITAIGTMIIAVTGLIVLFVNLWAPTEANNKMIVPVIELFEITPSQIIFGDSAELTWRVSNSDSVVLNNNIGSVPYMGSKKIFPVKTTTYTLSTILNNTKLSISKNIIVTDSLNNIIK